jgi:membrane protein implicated in regulation of membrane protease activity
MYGAFSGISFGLVAVVALMVIALAVFASPVIAVIIFLVAGIFLLIGMSALRQRSRAQDETGGGSDTTATAAPPGRAAGRHPGGEPASGEG